MELRGRSHWHFIQAIKGGEVIKLMNVDTRGQPEIKLKTVRDVYGTEDGEVHNSVPIVHLRDDLGVSPSESPRVKVEFIDQIENDDDDDDDDEKGVDQDDFSFSSTLKEFMERCKIKKRKCSTRVNNCEGSAKSRSSEKQVQEDDSDLDLPLSSWKAKLSKNVKRRKCFIRCVPNSQNLLSIVKHEQGYAAEDCCRTSDNWLTPLDIKVETCEMVFSDSQDISFAAADSQDISFPAADCNSDHSEGISYCPLTDDGVPASVDSPTRKAGVFLNPTIEAQNCSVNEISYEFREDTKPSFVGDLPRWDIIEVNSPEAIDVQFEDSMDLDEEIHEEGCFILPLSYDLSSCSLFMENESGMLHDSLTRSSNHDSQACSWDQSEAYGMTNTIQYSTEKCGTLVNQSSLEHRNSLDHGLSDGASTWGIGQIDEHRISHSQYLDPCYNGGGYIKSEVPVDIISESTSPTMAHSSYIAECLERDTSGPAISLTTLDSQVKVSAMAIDSDLGCLRFPAQANTSLPDFKSTDSCKEDSYENALPEMAILHHTRPHGLQYTRSNLAGSRSPIKACDTETNYDSRISENSDQCSTCSLDDSKNSHIPEQEYKSVLPSRNSYDSCTKDSCYSAAKKPSISGEKKGQSVRPDDAQESCYFTDCPRDTSDEHILSDKLNDTIHLKQQHPPEKLFSNRKVLSPSSQRKLRKAMESTELDEDDLPGCKEKFYIGIHSNHRILKAEGINRLKIARSTTNTKQTFRKPKHDQTGNGAESFSKVSHHDCCLCNAETGWFCSQNCSRSAINFSKQQMKDIQSVASKLTKELNCMKNIVKQMWAASANTSFKQQHITQVRAALENATRVEETSKQRLMHMSRNCMRFCKVMELAEGSPAASGNTSDSNPRKRKITFADESGGKLCNIMVIEDDERTVDTRSVSQELLAEVV